jgi:protein TonB
MNDAVAGAISERRNVNGGFLRSLAVSGACHLAVLSTGVALLKPAQPLRVAWDIPVPQASFLSPPSGPSSSHASGVPEAEPRAILKPPVARRSVAVTDGPKTMGSRSLVRSHLLGEGGEGMASASQEGGLQLLDSSTAGDWYLATIRSRVWALWASVPRAAVKSPAVVEFAILRDGGLEDARVVESSGNAFLDQAALRAVTSAAPFPPLPKHYEKDRCTIRGVFRPS